MHRDVGQSRVVVGLRVPKISKTRDSALDSRDSGPGFLIPVSGIFSRIFNKICIRKSNLERQHKKVK